MTVQECLVKLNHEKEILWESFSDWIIKRSPRWLLKVFDIKY